VLLSGALQKEMVGSSPGGLIHSMWLDLGPDATARFVSVVQKMINSWMQGYGFSVGVADCMPSKDLQNFIDDQKS